MNIQQINQFIKEQINQKGSVVKYFTNFQSMQKNFTNNDNKKAIIAFFPSCPYCQKAFDILEPIIKSHRQIEWIFIEANLSDMWENAKLTNWAIKVVPTIFLANNTQIVYQKDTFLDGEEIEKYINLM